MLVDAAKLQDLEREARDRDARIAAMEKTLAAYQQALVRFGHRVALCDRRISRLEMKTS